MKEVKIKSALISVFNKDGLEPIIKELDNQGVIIYSTGGTQKFINDLGVKVVRVEDLTSYPSILGGRVKTLHPKVFGGILNRQDNDSDKKELIDTYEYCNNIYIKLLKDLTIELNRIHGLKKNTESWEVIIGKWLLEFIYICHKNFFLCQKALKENQFKSIIMIEPNSYSLHVGDTEDFSWATNDSSWNLCLNSKIVEFLNSDKNKIYIKLNQKSFIRKKNKIKSINPSQIIIAVTADGLLFGRESYLDAGFDGFISKPYNKIKLFTEIENALNVVI